MNEEKKILVIDRLTGRPIGESDPNEKPELQSWQRIWTVDEIRARAEELGKPFEINQEIADRLTADLASGGLVLFTQDEVEEAFESGLIPDEMRSDLADLVSPDRNNDIAVLLLNALPPNDQITKLQEWFVTNNRC